MSPRQRIVRVEGVIELGVQPIGRRVAIGACVRQAELNMRRVLAICKVGDMARIAVCRRSRKHIVDMTRCARQCGVHTRQCITRIFQVIKLRIKPAVHGVAAFASGWKSQRHVIDNRRLKVLLMA
jgi:hypothetical protein